MSHRDISAELAAVAPSYRSEQVPDWLIRIQELLQQLLQALQDIIENFFRLRPHGGTNSTAMSTVIQFAVYALGIVAVLAICYVLWKKAQAKTEKLAATKRGAAAVEKILDSAGYKAEAASFAKSGDFKSACRSIYLCFLQNMHEKSVVVFAPAKTNFEYRYLLVGYPSLQKEFVNLADIVEHVWFGNRRAEEADYNACLRLLDQADSEVERISQAKIAAEKELVHD